MCQMNGNYYAESKNVKVLIDQTGQNTENELFPDKMSHKHYLLRASRYCCKGNIAGGIFINCGHDNYQHLEEL